MADEDLDIAIEAHSSGEHAIRDLKDAIDDLRRSVLETNAIMDANTAAMAANTAAQEAMNGSALTSGARFLGMSQAMLIAIGAVVGLSVVFSPLLVELAASITLLSAFAVGLTAAISVMTVGLGALGLLAAGVFLLGNRMVDAESPMAKLIEHLKAMADVLSRQALPLANALATAMDALVLPVQNAGSTILSWFGDRLPTVMGTFRLFIEQIGPAWEHLGQVMSSFLDQFMARSPQLAELFGRILDFGVGAVDGLLQNLLRLSDWFMSRLPTMGPIVAGIMSNIGGWLQDVGFQSGRLVDWFTQHWPEITQAAQATWNALRDGWAQVNPMLDLFLGNMSDINSIFQFVRDHAKELEPYIRALGVVAAFVGVMVFGLVVALAGLLSILEVLSVAVRTTAAIIGNAFGAMAAVVHTTVAIVSGMLANLAGAFWAAFGSAASAVGMVLSLLEAIPGAVGRASRAIPGVTGAIGAIESVGNALGFFQEGGMVPGPVGAPMLAVVHGGERVQTPEQQRQQQGSDWTDRRIVAMLERVEAAVYSLELDARIDRRVNSNLWST